MAELTEETIQRLNNLLARLAGPEPGERRDFEQEREGMSSEQKMRSLQEEMRITDASTTKYKDLSDELARLAKIQKNVTKGTEEVTKGLMAGEQAADNLTSRMI